MKHFLLPFLVVWAAIPMFSQWTPIGHPPKNFHLTHCIGDSVFVMVEAGKIMTSRRGKQEWDILFESNLQIAYGTADSHFIYCTSAEHVLRLDRKKRIIEKIPFDNLSLQRRCLHYSPKVGLIGVDKEKKIIWRSMDHGESWDTLLTLNHLPTIPTHSTIWDIQEDHEGHLFIIYKSNWQTHVILFSEGRQSKELINTWYEFYDLSMTSDSTLYYRDERGWRYKPRHEKYPKELTFRSLGDTIYPSQVILTGIDSLIFEFNSIMWSSPAPDQEARHLYSIPEFFSFPTVSQNLVIYNDGYCQDLNHAFIYNKRLLDTFTEKKFDIPALSNSRELIQPENEKLHKSECLKMFYLDNNLQWPQVTQFNHQGPVEDFKNYFYNHSGRELLRSTDLVSWTSSAPPLKFRTSYNLPDVHKFGTDFLTIKDDSCTYITTDLLEWASFSELKSIEHILKLSKHQWLIYGIDDNLQKKWIVTTDGGKTWSPAPQLGHIINMGITEFGTPYLLQGHGDTLRMVTLEFDLTAKDTINIAYGNCLYAVVYSVCGNNVMAQFNDELLLVNLDDKSVFRTDTSLPYRSPQRTLIQTANKSIYLHNPVDQIYRWDCQNYSTQIINDGHFTLQQNPFHEEVILLIPDEYQDKKLHIKLYSLQGQLIMEKSFLAGPNLHLAPLRSGYYSMVIFFENQMIDHLNLISQ